MELGVSKLGSECPHCTGSCMWPCVYTKGQGRVSASSFVPGGV